jgi:replication factor C small subunit
MSFIFEEETKKQDNHYLWVEKYRPDTLNGYIGSEHLKETIKSFIDKKDIPHLMFYGTAGVGKTTLAKLITKNIPCDVMYINASDENSVETVRTKIKGFASTTGFNKLKVIILDECDFLSAESMGALRNLMETFSLTTRFILTCNYQEKIIAPIISRCQTYQINPISKKEIAIHLKKVLDIEKVEHSVDDIGFIINNYYPDIRKILNFAQQNTIDSKLKLNSYNAIGTDVKNKLIEMLKTSNNIITTFNSIRQLVADNDIKVFDEYYSILYDKVSEYSKGKDVSVIITIAEYIHQSSLVVDKEITFMACIASILKTILK